MTQFRSVLAAALLAVASLALPALAAIPKADVAGSADHPVLKRFAGSLLVGYAQQDWEQRRFPDASGVAPNKEQFNQPVAHEGKVTRLFYLAPQGKSPLEVFRNHEQALLAAGFKTTWRCQTEAEGCVKAFFALERYERMKGMRWAEGDLPSADPGRSGSWALPTSISFGEGRMLVGSLGRGGQTLQLLLYTSQAANEHTGRAATYIEIVEPRAMTTGQVSVDAGAIGAGLKAEGKVALPGLHFDTGKTDIRPESAAQLDQMVAALKSQPALKVFIVGHTDNVGSVEANLKLSQGRAQAVVAALAQRGIAANRLIAHGNAGYAPVASNASEEGRARNRRVEMVLQ